MRCRMCSNPVGKWKQHYCSDACRVAFDLQTKRQIYHATKVLWDHAPRICPVCHNSFIPKIGKQRICSKACRAKACTVTREAKECLECSKKFLGMASQKFCCERCQLRCYRRIRRKLPQEKARRKLSSKRRYRENEAYRNRCKAAAAAACKRNPVMRIRFGLRKRIRRLIRGEIRICQLIGCGTQQLRERLENQFRGEMTWANYGKLWVVDHITPLAAFNLDNPVELGYACHFTNLQPLTVLENQEKAARIL